MLKAPSSSFMFMHKPFSKYSEQFDYLVKNGKNRFKKATKPVMEL